MAYQKVAYPPRKCAVCETVFTPGRRDKRFCSAACRSKYRHRVRPNKQRKSKRTRQLVDRRCTHPLSIGDGCYLHEHCGTCPFADCAADAADIVNYDREAKGDAKNGQPV